MPLVLRLDLQLCYFQFLKRFKSPNLTRYVHTSTSFIRSKLETNWLLAGLSKSGRIDEAFEMFDKMSERDEFSWNTMISAFSNAGRLDDAASLFNRTPIKDCVAWNSLISGYCLCGHEEEALDLFWKMQVERQHPNQYTLGSVLRMCSSLALHQRGQQIHAYSIKTNFDSNAFVVTGLLDMYAKCKCISEAEILFKTMTEQKNHVTWTTMLTGYSQNGFEFKAIECFRDMKKEGIESNHYTFPSILTICAAVSARDFGEQIHSCIVKTGFTSSIFVQSALVNMYGKCGELKSAKMVLDSAEVDDAISWNSMIVNCARQGLREEALSSFQKMHQRNMKIDEFAIPSVLNCFTQDVSKSAESVHGLTVKTGYEAFRLVGNALIDMYAKKGNIDSALKAFYQISNKDVISWTALVTGFSHNCSYVEALKFFCHMRSASINPDPYVMASALNASAELTLLEFGRQLHGNSVISGLQSSLSVDNALVSMYTEFGCIEEANKVFNLMHAPDVITWTALIVGYAKNGKAKESLRFYDQMISNGVKPDYVTFIGLLFACSHAGLFIDAAEFFKSMRRAYGITPGPEHYACMVDLYCRSGNLVKAEELLNQMDTKPDATIWKSFLAACRIHGNLEQGEKAAKILMELEPTNAVPYVLLSNMYSSAGKWNKAARIRTLMKSRSINKEPGCSWFEMSGKLHTFMSDDRSHVQTDEIYSKIDEMIMLIKEAGYVPDANCALHDTDKEAKEHGLAYHSEKLATAFALLIVPPGGCIRIFKNLRVCGDCHNAMKYISRVYKRHIVLRDSNCFHHFRDGGCSCGDYW